MLSKRRITRLLSVEVCYASYFSDLEQAKLIERVIALHEVSYMKNYDPELLNSLLSLCLHQAEADTQLIGRFLSKDWDLNRMDNLKLSILRVSIAEFRLNGTEQKNLVIDEYVSLARVFLPEKELGFINAILNNLAAEVQKKVT